MSTTSSAGPISGARASSRSSVAVAVALTFSVALVVAGFLLPVYSSEGASSSGAVVEDSRTLVAENGVGIAFVLAVPLLVSLVVAAALRRPYRRGMLPLAWTFTGVLAAFNLLALLTIGIFILPVTVALVVASSTARREPAAS